MKLYQTFQHPFYNQRKMEKHILIKGKGLRETLPLLENNTTGESFVFKNNFIMNFIFERYFAFA